MNKTKPENYQKSNARHGQIIKYTVSILILQYMAPISLVVSLILTLKQCEYKEYRRDLENK